MDPGSERGQRDGGLCEAKRASLQNLVAPQQQCQGRLARPGLVDGKFTIPETESELTELLGGSSGSS